MELNIRFSHSLQDIKYYFLHFRSVYDQCSIQVYTLCCCTCNHIRVILLTVHTNKLFFFRISLFAVMYGIGDGAASFPRTLLQSFILYKFYITSRSKVIYHKLFAREIIIYNHISNNDMEPNWTDVVYIVLDWYVSL